MADFNAIPMIPLKLVFAIHFILISWALQGIWSPDSYQFYNLFFLLALVWSIYEKEKEEPLQITILINFCAIVMDIVVILFYFPYHGYVGTVFSYALAILNLVFRPVSTVIMGKNCANRMGLSGGFYPATFGTIFDLNPAEVQRNSYEDIDSTSVGVLT